MRDESIAFYDANIPLGKAFKSTSNENLISDPL